MNKWELALLSIIMGAMLYTGYCLGLLHKEKPPPVFPSCYIGDTIIRKDGEMYTCVAYNTWKQVKS